MKLTIAVGWAIMGTGCLLLSAAAARAQGYTQGFNSGSDLTGIVFTNNSTRNAGGFTWSLNNGITNTTSGAIVVPPFEGDGMASANFSSIGSGTGTISNWMFLPEFKTLQNGDKFSFYTTTTPGSTFPDRLEFRLSTAGASTDLGGTGVNAVGTFTTILQSVNATLAVSGYPENWTQYTVTLGGLSGLQDGRVAFRYFVTDAGPTGTNSNIVGVDDFVYAAVPEPLMSSATAGAGAILLGGFCLSRRRLLRPA